MKNQYSKKIIILLVGISFIFAAFPVYGDTKTDTYETPLPTLVENIPASVTEFIDCNFSSITDVMANSPDKNYMANDIKLGTPYIVYNFNEYQDEVYYYPLIADDKIEAVLGIIGTDWGYTYEISYDYGLIELLDRMDYLNNDCIFYTVDNELYYESSNGVNAKPDILLSYSAEQLPYDDESAFAEMSFEEKQREITDKLASFRYVDTQSFDKNEPDNMKYGAMKTVTLRKPQSQYAYNMCWACVVATIANTLNWTSYTGYDVCSRMGIGFDTGAEIEEIKTALSYYGVDYKKTNDALGWDKIKQNIDAGYPIAMCMVPYYSTSDSLGHSITLYGYNSTNHYIEIWNSQSQYNPNYKENENNNPNLGGYSKAISYYNQKIDIIYEPQKNSIPIVSSDYKGIAYLWNQTLSEYN